MSKIKSCFIIFVSFSKNGKLFAGERELNIIKLCIKKPFHVLDIHVKQMESKDAVNGYFDKRIIFKT